MTTALQSLFKWFDSFRSCEVQLSAHALSGVVPSIAPGAADGEAEAFARLDSPAERLRYLQETVGLNEREALRSLSAWIEALSVKAQPKEPDAGAIAERLVKYEVSDAPAYEE